MCPLKASWGNQAPKSARNGVVVDDDTGLMKGRNITLSTVASNTLETLSPIAACKHGDSAVTMAG